MKLILMALSLAATAMLFFCCKHQPKFTADTLPTKQLRWGTGGGFAGLENTRVLLENGQIFANKLSGPLAEAKKTKAKTATTLFKTVQALDLAKLEFSHPGNLYSFLEIQEGDAIQRITWGDPNFPVNPAVQAAFDQLNGLVK